MSYYLLGKFVDTHALKGEIRIISDCYFKAKVFKQGNPIYLGKDKIRYEVESYRQHQKFDLVKLKGVTKIEEIEALKGALVYINKEELGVSGELQIIEHLIGYKVYDGSLLIGYVVDYIKGPGLAHDILVVGDAHFKIPYIEEFIISVCSEERVIKIKNIRGLLDEN